MTSLHNSIFSAVSYDHHIDIDNVSIIASDCTLKCSVGKFKAGEKFDEIMIDYSNGIIILNGVHKYNLKLKIVDK